MTRPRPRLLTVEARARLSGALLLLVGFGLAAVIAAAPPPRCAALDACPAHRVGDGSPRRPPVIRHQD